MASRDLSPSGGVKSSGEGSEGSDLKSAAALLNEALTGLLSGMPRPPGKEDWEYRDIPKVHEKFWPEFIDTFGEENIHWITFAEYRYGDGLYKRGQFFVSPAGLERARLKIAAKKAAKATAPLTARPDQSGSDLTREDQ